MPKTFELRAVTEVCLFYLKLEPIPASMPNYQAITVMANDKDRIREFINGELADDYPYYHDGVYKKFKLGSPLEKYTMPPMHRLDDDIKAEWVDERLITSGIIHLGARFENPLILDEQELLDLLAYNRSQRDDPNDVGDLFVHDHKKTYDEPVILKEGAECSRQES